MIPVVLSVGALDPLGADGVLADARTCAALGAQAAAAVALIGTPPEPLAPEAVAAQIATVLAAGPVAAVKLGALGSAAMVRAVAGALAGCAAPVVADPSLAGRDGAAADPEAVAAWREAVLPIAELVTPNLAEAALLTGTERATTLGEMTRQAQALVDLGAGAAVVGGGHGQSTSSIDILFVRDRPPIEMRADRLDRAGMRGLSATLAAAIAAHLAHGLKVFDAVQAAKLFASSAIAAAADQPVLGPHQMHRMWRRRDAGAVGQAEG